MQWKVGPKSSLNHPLFVGNLKKNIMECERIESNRLVKNVIEYNYKLPTSPVPINRSSSSRMPFSPSSSSFLFFYFFFIFFNFHLRI
jgi:hypothetical protein